MTNINEAVRAVEANTAAQNIHALPPRAQISAPLARPFNLAPVDSVDSRGEWIATTVSVMRLSHYKHQGNYVVMELGDATVQYGIVRTHNLSLD